MRYLGDFALGSTVRFMFNSWGLNQEAATLVGGTVIVNDLLTGAPITLDTPPVLTVDVNGVTGKHLVVVDLDDADMVAGDYVVVLSAGVVDGKQVSPAVLAQFSVQNRYAAAAQAAILAALPAIEADTYYTDTISAGGVPQEGVEVRVYSDPNRTNQKRYDVTDELGAFEVVGLAPGTYYARADGPPIKTKLFTITIADPEA